MRPERAPYGIQQALRLRTKIALYHASQILEAQRVRNKVAEQSYAWCLQSDVLMLCELFNQGAAYAITRTLRRG